MIRTLTPATNANGRLGSGPTASQTTTASAATAIGGTFGITNAIVVPDEVASIATAANMAEAAMNTIVVKPGTYIEAINPNPSKEVYIRSVDGPQATMILNSVAANDFKFVSDYSCHGDLR